MDVAEFCPAVATVLEGFSTIGTGASAISTGLSLFSKIPVLNVIAVLSIAIGVTTVALGINQVISGVTGTNVIKEAFRMSDGAYEALYLGANIASLVCVVTGRIAAGLKGIKCFIGGTLVATEDGLKPIEEIEVGDKVLAYDEETGEQAYKKVVRLFRNETYEWYHIFVNDEEIVCTGGHPFYVLNAEEDRKVVRYEGVKSDKNGRWIEAKELKKDDKLLLSDGSYGIIISVKIEELETLETTYNFEVEDFHTYFVGENEVLTHNKCTPNNAKRYSAEEIAKKYDISVDEFHNDIKPEILKRVKPKYNVGKNPDIALNRVGDIAYQGAKGPPFSKGFQDTGLNIVDIINDFHGGV